MAFSFARASSRFFAMALFSTLARNNPIGQLPEVQREQPDPAKDGRRLREKF
jgi:hypothetical protein